MYDQILYENQDGVGVITLNRPDRLNAWTGTLQQELMHATLKAGEDDDVRVIVITGAGRGFCAGADMDTLVGLQGGNAKEEVTDVMREAAQMAQYDVTKTPEFQMPLSFFWRVPKPVLCAINGPVAGIGFAMTLFTDIRFAADSAVFTTAFSRRGLIAEHGMSWTLPRLVGMQAALDLLFSARKFKADEAKDLGLVSQVFPTNDFMSEVMAYANMLAKEVSPRSLKVMKRQLLEAQFQTLPEAYAIAETEMRATFTTDDFKEGVAHFLEKRAPKFTGT